MTQKDFEMKVDQLRKIADDFQKEGEGQENGLLTNMGLFIELMLLSVAKEDFHELSQLIRTHLKYKADQERKIRSLLKGLEIN